MQSNLIFMIESVTPTCYIYVLFCSASFEQESRNTIGVSDVLLDDILRHVDYLPISIASSFSTGGIMNRW
jgi:hypothetical protein